MAQTHYEVQSRRAAESQIRKAELAPEQSSLKLLICLLVSLCAFLIPDHELLNDAARRCLFIVLLGAGLWFTEAMAAYAVSLLIIGLEIALLGEPGGVFATGPKDWHMFIQPLAHPLIFLFLAGFILSAATSKTGLDRYVILHLLKRIGQKPQALLLGIMLTTFTLSMFMSNTATTAIMLLMVTPMIEKLDTDDRFRIGLLLAVPFSANIGGMGSIIGTPPNAIGAGLLEPIAQIDFLQWMVLGVPPAFIGLLILYIFIRRYYPPKQQTLPQVEEQSFSFKFKANKPGTITALTVLGTIVLWTTSSLHGLPTNVVSFIPICVFTTTGILVTSDIRKLPWEVLLLLGGGLSLGATVQATGLADYLTALLPLESAPVLLLSLLIALATVVFSNFMSNTAAANVILPVALAAALSGQEMLLVLPATLAASCAMALPISTPPNAIAYASGHLQFKDFLRFGIAIGVIMPFLLCAWIWFCQEHLYGLLF